MDSKDDTLARDAAASITGIAASATVFTPITAPVLRSVDPVCVAAFLKERERYELEVKAKAIEMPSLTPVALVASIDRSLLRSLIYMGELEKVAPGVSANNVTDDQLGEYIKSLVRRDGSDYDPGVVSSVLAELKFPTGIRDARARITSYCAEFFERLEAVGYENFREDNPKQTAKLILQRIQPAALKQKMFQRMNYDQSLEKSVPKLISKLQQEAISCQEYGEGVGVLRGSDKGEGSSSNGQTSANSRGTRGRRGNNQGRDFPAGKGDSKKEENKGEKEKDKNSSGQSEPPLCLWEDHKSKGIRHFMRDCKDCPAEKRKELLDELFSRKRKDGSGAKRAAGGSCTREDSTVIFSAHFAGRVCDTLCADIGADANLMGQELLNRIKDAGGVVEMEDLLPPRTFCLAADAPDGSKTKLICTQAATMDVDIHIRHGTGLKLRNTRWLVSTQRVPEPLLGRPLLEFLGLNTMEILATAADRSAGVIDTKHLPESLNDIGEGRVSRVLEGVYYGDGDHDTEAEDSSINLDQGSWCDIGEEDDDEWNTHLQERLKEATKSGITPEGRARLEFMLREHRDVVRIRLNGRPPAHVLPMTVHVKPDAVPVRAKPRRYPPQKRDFLRRYTNALQRMGFVKPASQANWVAAPLVVPKKPPALFRLTMDYRPINAATKKTVWPMPHIDAALSDLRGATIFAGIDFCSGYWQLPLSEESQPLYAFTTCDAIVQPTRTTQGGCNSPANFQEKVEPCFSPLRENLLAWLDDFILHGKEEKEHLDNLLQFLEICATKNLVISITKSRFFAKVIEWCGRLIDAGGVQLHPANYEGLVDAEIPRNGAELSQYVHCANWMSSVIPRFAERVAPLREILEKAYTRSGRRTTASVAKVQLAAIGWTDTHKHAFRDIQEQLKNAVKTAHRNQEMTLCLYTDASDNHWAGVVTQCEPHELRKTIDMQSHEPLAFLGGSFTGAQEHWSTYEREAFAIVQSIRKLDYMFACEESTVIFTDHRNLLFVFHPTAIERTLGRHKVLKVLRWALYMSTFTYRIEHVPGTQNIMADIMTRWLRGYRGQIRAVRRIKGPLPPVPTAPAAEDEWPDREVIREAQNAQDFPPPTRASTDEDGLIRCNGRVWLPVNAHELQLKLLTIAHCGTAGHRGADATFESLKPYFTWIGQRRDTADFVAACLFCNLSKTGAKIPRPLAATLHASRPNEVLHFDYLYMGGSDSGEIYVLVLKDDFSGYAWLEPTKSANAEHTASTLARWNHTFTSPVTWVSDQGSHFINETLRTMASDHRISHRPTIAYSPWTNGTVERINRDVLAAYRALIAELNLAPQDWPSIVGLLPTILNEAPLSRLGKDASGNMRCPLQVMTGIKPRRVILRVIPDITSVSKPILLDRARAEQRIDIESLQTSLDAMHKDVKTKVDNRRRRAIEAHNKATNIINPRFETGDFVLVRQAEKARHKLMFRWSGPRRVVNPVSNMVYLVERLDGTRRERVHCARLAGYSALLDNKEVPDDVLELADRTETRFEVLHRIIDIGEEGDDLWLQLEWDGLPDERDWTWAKLSDMHEDVPDMVEQFLRTAEKNHMVIRAAAQLGITI